ncbi:NUDIX domain-containing protein [Flavobacteriaceae bacterium D16]|nr:NUDIX domain-containing protein [Flavobacteriaceae bacterium D16]
MLFKKQENQEPKKANPVVGLLLFLISLILVVLTVPLGFIYGVCYKIFTKGLTGLGEYTLKIAVSIDQLGNVIMQHLLNHLWIRNGGYKFGNRDETISSALGRNKVLGTLTGFGKFIDRMLDILDPNHSLNSIDYYIEPTEDIIDKVAWILIENKRILCVRSKDKELFYLPGGKRESGETDKQTLLREIQEELSVALDPQSLIFVKVFEAPADGQSPGVIVRMHCYKADYSGELQPDEEIAEMKWLSYEQRHHVSVAGQLIFDYYKALGEI